MHPGVQDDATSSAPAGYSLRPSLRVEDIAPIVEISKRKAPDAIVMVDNCYGEFVEREEPLAVGADIIDRLPH